MSQIKKLVRENYLFCLEKSENEFCKVVGTLTLRLTILHGDLDTHPRRQSPEHPWIFRLPVKNLPSSPFFLENFPETKNFPLHLFAKNFHSQKCRRSIKDHRLHVAVIIFILICIFISRAFIWLCAVYLSVLLSKFFVCLCFVKSIFGNNWHLWL